MQSLREKYRITDGDIKTMVLLRRKWAFDDLTELLVSDECDVELTDEQVERVIDEYLDLRIYNRGDWELEAENEDMREAIDRVVRRKGE